MPYPSTRWLDSHTTIFRVVPGDQYRVLGPEGTVTDCPTRRMAEMIARSCELAYAAGWRAAQREIISRVMEGR